MTPHRFRRPTYSSRTDAVAVVWSILLVLSIAALVYLLSSCCKTPTCPPPIQHLTTVVSSCELPPGPGKLPAVVRAGADAGCPERLVCYDVPAAAALAERNSRMVQWIREVKARCGSLPSNLDGGVAVPVDSGRAPNQ